MTVKQIADSTVLKAFIHGQSELPLHNVIVRCLCAGTYSVTHNGVKSRLMGYYAAIAKVESIVNEDNLIIGQLMGWED